MARFRLGDACLRLRPRHGHGGAEAADLLTSDADNRLTGDGLAHVLGFSERTVAVVDDRLEVRNGAGLHVGLRLANLADAKDDSFVVLPLDDQRLDELGADVEDGEMALEFLAPLEQGKLSLSDQAACPIVSVIASRSTATAASRLAGSPTLPRPRSGRPPPLPPVICAALVTRVPAWTPASCAPADLDHERRRAEYGRDAIPVEPVGEQVVAGLRDSVSVDVAVEQQVREGHASGVLDNGRIRRHARGPKQV